MLLSSQIWHKQNKRVMKSLIITGFMMLVAVTITAQQLYQTQNGTVTLTGKFKSADVMAESKSLHMLINYDKATLQMHLPLTSFVTTNQTLSTVVQNLVGQQAQFTGKMDIRFVQTNAHPKQKFKVQGTLSINGITKSFQFTAQLEYFPRGNATCILSGNLSINLDDFKVVTEPGEHLINARFNQVVLKRVGEQ